MLCIHSNKKQLQYTRIECFLSYVSDVFHPIVHTGGYCHNFSQIGLLVLFEPRVEKEQYRSVIRFIFLQEKSRSEIKKRLDAVYDSSSLSIATGIN